MIRNVNKCYVCLVRFSFTINFSPWHNLCEHSSAYLAYRNDLFISLIRMTSLLAKARNFFRDVPRPLLMMTGILLLLYFRLRAKRCP